MIIFVKIKFSSHLLKYDSKNFRSGPNFLFQIIAGKISYSLSIKNVTIYYVTITFLLFYDFKKIENFQSEIWPCSTPPKIFYFLIEFFSLFHLSYILKVLVEAHFCYRHFTISKYFVIPKNFWKKKYFFWKLSQILRMVYSLFFMISIF